MPYGVLIYSNYCNADDVTAPAKQEQSSTTGITSSPSDKGPHLISQLSAAVFQLTSSGTDLDPDTDDLVKGLDIVLYHV